MPRPKTLSVAPIIKLIVEMNKVGPELTALYEFCKGMQPDGISSLGPSFNKERLKILRRMLLELGHALPDAKNFTLELRNSGFFSRNPTPLNLLA